MNLILIVKKLTKNVINKTTGELIKCGSFPSNSGIAGIAFTERRAIFGITGRTEYLFQDVDHAIMNGKINNFLFVPLYGYDEEVVGILEFINKKDEDINKNEMEKLEVYQRSIGLMIKHITEMNTTLAASFSIKRLLYHINNPE